MTVHFIGAGPGAADLITVRGRDLIARCPVCLYAGSIVPPELLAHCPAGARIVDTAPMTLDEIEAEFVAAHAAGHDVARLHSGDLSIYSALAEQIRRLERRGIPYTLTPGVPAFAAAAAALGRELTVPEVAQSVVLTRMPGRASRMPEGERLPRFAATGATLAIHLAIHGIDSDRRRADAVLRRRLSGRRGGAGELARRAHRARHARRHRGQGRGRADRAHRARAGRARARGGGFSRQRALRPGLSPPVPREARRDGVERRAARPDWPSRSNNTTSIAIPLPSTTRAAIACAACATASPSAMPSACACAKASAAVLAARMRSRNAALPPAASRETGERRQIDRAALRMQVEQALRELGHLGDAARDGDPRHRMGAHIFQHAADEVAHVDQRGLGQSVELAHRRLRGRARSRPRYGRARRRAPRRCRDGSRRSRPSRNTARRCRWCRGSTGRRRCRGAH